MEEKLKEQNHNCKTAVGIRKFELYRPEKEEKRISFLFAALVGRSKEKSFSRYITEIKVMFMNGEMQKKNRNKLKS